MSTSLSLHVCPHHDNHIGRIEALEDDVTKHGQFHAWFREANIKDKIERSYNLLVGLVFLQGFFGFMVVLIAVKKGLF